MEKTPSLDTWYSSQTTKLKATKSQEDAKQFEGPWSTHALNLDCFSTYEVTKPPQHSSDYEHMRKYYGLCLLFKKLFSTVNDALQKATNRRNIIENNVFCVFKRHDEFF